MWTLDTFIISFFIYSFIGWCCEVVYCSIPKKRFLNRGFMFGPYLPIYGSGAMVVLTLLRPFYDKWYLVFIFGVISTSIIEYFTSWALEKIFKIKLWDYSKHPININGRVCELNSTLFGIMSLVLVYIVDEPVRDLISKIKPFLLEPTAMVIVAILSADFATSVVKMSAFRKAVEEINRAKADAEEKIKAFRAENAENMALLKEKLYNDIENLRARYYKNAKHIFNSNPSLTGNKDMRLLLLNAKLGIEERTARLKELKRIRKAEKRKNG